MGARGAARILLMTYLGGRNPGFWGSGTCRRCYSRRLLRAASPAGRKAGTSSGSRGLRGGAGPLNPGAGQGLCAANRRAGVGRGPGGGSPGTEGRRSGMVEGRGASEDVCAPRFARTFPACCLPF